jgi:predicted metal-dependent phosphoesterase TrpH
MTRVMCFVDLHTHSTASDGTVPPRDVVRLAAEQGLAAIALTDHDTIAGVVDAAEQARLLGIEFLPGIEISCEYPRPGTMHLLGYGIDASSRHLRDMTIGLLDARNERNSRMVKRLQEIGIPVSMDDILEEAGDGVVGRPHFANVLVKKGIVSSRSEAFNIYLGQGGRAYLDKERLGSSRAIELIHASGGVAVLAHPSQLLKENFAQLRTEVRNLVDQGLDGIEVVHSDHREALIQELSDLADDLKLLKTGGSDFHGDAKPHIRLGFAGARRVPMEYYEQLRGRLQPAATPGTRS